MRHLPFRNQTACEFTLPTWHHHQSGAQINTRMHHAGHAGDVKHRHRQQSHIFMRAATPNSRGNGVVHDGAVRMHATLWQTGGATGIGQHRQIVGARQHGT